MGEMTAPEEPTSVFVADGTEIRPTDAARGPWNRDVLHGAAVAALLAGSLECEGEVVVRVLIELHGPVPFEALTVDVAPTEGGRRVKRQSATLRVDGRTVASGSVTRMRRGEVSLPGDAQDHPVRFDPADQPDLTTPNLHAADVIGWSSFDSVAMATRWERSSGPGPRRLWLRLLMPVISGRELTGASRPGAVRRVVLHERRPDREPRETTAG